MFKITPRLTAFLPLVLVLAACGGAATTAPLTYAPATAAPSNVAASPTTTASPTSAPSQPSAAPSAASSGETLEATSVGSQGVVLVAANGMTVYSFTEDVKDSGASACTADCLAIWPALTVPAGTTPTAGTGVTGKLGTFVRADDGTTQVTYNGLPLYFFSNDKAPGDANGVYPEWEAVKP